jgi:hypothetical protein
MTHQSPSNPSYNHPVYLRCTNDATAAGSISFWLAGCLQRLDPSHVLNIKSFFLPEQQRSWLAVSTLASSDELCKAAMHAAAVHCKNEVRTIP